ncbi:unnamed protein product, partial [Amoebophrya sp. A25]
ISHQDHNIPFDESSADTGDYKSFQPAEQRTPASAMQSSGRGLLPEVGKGQGHHLRPEASASSSGTSYSGTTTLEVEHQGDLRSSSDVVSNSIINIFKEDWKDVGL